MPLRGPPDKCARGANSIQSPRVRWRRCLFARQLAFTYLGSMAKNAPAAVTLDGRNFNLSLSVKSEISQQPAQLPLCVIVCSLWFFLLFVFVSHLNFLWFHVCLCLSFTLSPVAGARIHEGIMCLKRAPSVGGSAFLRSFVRSFSMYESVFRNYRWKNINKYHSFAFCFIVFRRVVACACVCVSG